MEQINFEGVTSKAGLKTGVSAGQILASPEPVTSALSRSSIGI